METNNSLLILGNVILLFIYVVGYCLLVKYTTILEATCIIKKKSAHYGPVVTKETLSKERFFVSKTKGRYTNQWSDVRKFSFREAMFYCLIDKEQLTICDQEMEALLDSDGQVRFL